ncbi:hypothetical protein GGR25_002258 [Kaistia hirudinis]|uniref:Uncharacterized protein n=1 Tax=Kaistia hirudinis TaxID=1293440 RepID=A0A840API6_9HYPH|nr:hypothetical protein [Kaistia hirudinis]MBB3931208.1 hypothetical protein [Kaistia hirudinis]
MIKDLFEDPAEGTAPTMRQLSFLLDAGVPLDAIVAPWCLRVARVAFPERWRYAPSPMGDPSFVFAVIASDGIIDLAAWHPRTGRIGTRLGIGGLLGEGQIGRDGLGTTGLPLPVLRTPADWLMAHRKGLVVVDPQAAAYRLAGMTLHAVDVGHGRDLRDMLSLPRPFIVVPAQTRERIAA